MIEGWSLPSYFLSAPDASAGGMRVFQMLSLNVTDMATDKSPLDCKGKDAAAGVVVGSSGQDVLSCGLNRDITGKTFEKDVVFIGGPDNDKITDSVGNRIINGGTGDDSISVGAGRTLLVLDAAWGHDTVTMDCTGATVNEAEIQKGFPIPWVYKTTNFIVLGDGIDPKDVSWKDNVLTNTVTGDTLTVNQNCFTVVPSVQ
jgi:Ca2+-binding RTX toxin-like protein